MNCVICLNRQAARLHTDQFRVSLIIADDIRALARGFLVHTLAGFTVLGKTVFFQVGWFEGRPGLGKIGCGDDASHGRMTVRAAVQYRVMDFLQLLKSVLAVGTAASGQGYVFINRHK